MNNDFKNANEQSSTTPEQVMEYIYNTPMELSAEARVLEEALKHFPDSDLLLYNLGSKYSKLYLDEQGLKTFAKAFKANPNDVIGLTEYARLLKKNGHYTHAEELYARAIKIDGTDISTLIKMGTLYFESENYGFSHACFERAAFYQPKSDMPKRMLREIKTITQEPDQKEDYDQVLSRINNIWNSVLKRKAQPPIPNNLLATSPEKFYAGNFYNIERN